MNAEDLESQFLVYLKLFDGITHQNPMAKTACDLSFNHHITATYLTEKSGFEKVFSYFDDGNNSDHQKIVSVRPSPNLPKSLADIRCDLLVSLMGCFKFQPVYETVHAIHKCLNGGGKFVFAVYPTIFDEKGVDVLKSLSMIAEKPVYEKLVRWKSVLENGLSNIFVKVNTEELMQEVSFAEVMGILGSRGFCPYLFDNEYEYQQFIKPLKDVNRKKYTAVWNILTGIKI